MKKIIPLKQQEILTISGGTNAADHARTPEEKKFDNFCFVLGTIQFVAIALHTLNAITQKSLKRRHRRHQLTPQGTQDDRAITPEIQPEINIESPIRIIKKEEDWYQ